MNLQHSPHLSARLLADHLGHGPLLSVDDAGDARLVVPARRLLHQALEALVAQLSGATSGGFVRGPVVGGMGDGVSARVLDPVGILTGHGLLF
jgi:hypothetical protein